MAAGIIKLLMTIGPRPLRNTELKDNLIVCRNL